MGKKQKIILLSIVAAVAICAGLLVALIKIDWKVQQVEEVQRYCHTSKTLGQPPQCSDNNGQPERTWIDGNYLGIVNSVPQACWSNPEKNPGCAKVPTTLQTGQSKEQRLADPNLLYASMDWAGMCTNDKHEAGGCYDGIYLYLDGRVVKLSGFIKFNEGSQRDNIPSDQKQLTSAAIEQIKKIIRGSNILTKDCKPETIMDAGWDYQVNLDGVKKPFQNPPQECRDVFDKIDNIINPTEK